MTEFALAHPLLFTGLAGWSVLLDAACFEVLCNTVVAWRRKQ